MDEDEKFLIGLQAYSEMVPRGPSRESALNAFIAKNIMDEECSRKSSSNFQYFLTDDAKERLLANDSLSELFGWDMEVERGNGFYGTRFR